MTKNSRKLHVKTGCRTCKLRRLKCDETRPACQRCIFSGRVCDGYGIWGGGSIHTHTSDYMPTYWRLSALRQYKPAAYLVAYSNEDKAAFDFFCKCPSLKISGMFRSDFWDHLLIQVCTVEPAVFHAVLAIGSAYRTKLAKLESYGYRDFATEPSSLQTHKSFTLQYYNKAIQQLSRLLERKDACSLRFAAITCLLFICLEMLQRQYQSLERHYQYGAILFKEIQNGPAQPGDNHLLEAFTRLSTHLDLFSPSSPMPGAVSRKPIFVLGSSIPPVFNTVHGARLSIEQLLNSIIELRDWAKGANSDTPEAQVSMIRQHAALQSSMSAWKDAYQSSMKTVFAGFSILELIGVRLLRNYYTMASIVLGTCLCGCREICYDTFTSSFASIISQFEDVLKLIGCHEPQSSPPFLRAGEIEATFTVEMGSFVPVFFSALKCRDPALRRRAIRMLERSRHTEGMWSGPMLGRIATKVMRLEEDHSSCGRTPVLEESRFHHVEIDLSWTETSQEATLTCSRFKSGNCDKQNRETTYHKVELI